MKKYLAISILLIVPFLAAADTPGQVPVNAGTPGVVPVNTGTTGGRAVLDNPLKVNSVTDLLLSLIDVAIFVGVIIAVLVFIFIGFKFVMAQGNGDKLKEARQWFLYAVIGTAVLISSKVIVQVVKNTLTSAGVVNEDLFKQPK